MAAHSLSGLNACMANTWYIDWPTGVSCFSVSQTVGTLSSGDADSSQFWKSLLPTNRSTLAKACTLWRKKEKKIHVTYMTQDIKSCYLNHLKIYANTEKIKKSPWSLFLLPLTFLWAGSSTVSLLVYSHHHSTNVQFELNSLTLKHLQIINLVHSN